jgi:replicative DNA helicase
MQYLYETNQEPTPISVMEVLTNDKAKESIKEIGGLEYLTTLTKTDEKEKNLEIYIKKLKQTYTRRELCNISIEVLDEMLDDKTKVLNPNELITTVQNKIDDISVKESNVQEVHKMGEGLEERIKALSENPMEIGGLETHFYTFDKMTNGMFGGDLMFVCARAKMGKSVILTNWASNISIIDKMPILYINTEMKDEENENRLLAMLSGVPINEITSGQFMWDTEYGTKADKLERMKIATELIKSGNFHHIFMTDFNPNKIVSIARQYKNKYGIVAIFFDYLKLPANSANNLKFVKEYQELGIIATQLKDLAGILDIPIYSAVQANRNDVGQSAEDMDEGDIAGSDRILQLCSKLVFLAKKDEEAIALEGGKLGNIQARIKFQRNGACDCPPINIQFDREITRMTEVV